MASNTRYKDLLDYTVTYKAVWTVIGVAVAIGVAGWFAFQRFKPPGADEKARQVIKEAERLASRADGCVHESTPSQFLTRLSDGRARLTAAREEFDAGRFAEASTAAASARDEFREFNDNVCASLESVARFVDLKGDVKIKTAKSARWVTASRGTRLLPGDRLRVDSGVARIEFKNGEKQTLKKDTLIQISSYVPKPGGAGTAEIELQKGELLAEGVTNGDSTIRTDLGDAQPRAGDINLRLGDDGRALEARSLRGGAVFSHGDERRELGQVSRLEARRTDAGVELGPVREDLLGPDLRTPIDGRLFVAESPASELTVFEWRPVKDSSRYVFQIARNDWFDPILNPGEEDVPRGRVDLAEEAEILGLPEGTYHWRVAARADDGTVGRWSQAFGFTITQGSPLDLAREPPALDIESEVPVGDRYIFKGRCDPYARLQVYVNGKRWQDVDLDEAGGFSIMVPVEHEGWNTVTFEAQDTYGTKNSIDRRVYWSGF